MTRRPKISVVTATWNAASTIRDCLGSFQSQTYDSAEHVVVDGASSDGTLEILHSCRDNLATLVSEPDRGIYDALNKGIGYSTGDIVGFLHADDLFAHPRVLSAIADVFLDESVSAVYGDLQYVSQSDTQRIVRNWQSEPFEPGLLSKGWMPPHPTLYVRREWYSRIGGFDARLRIAADYLSILQLFANPEFKAIYIPSVMVKMRVGGASNSSVRGLIRKSREDWQALRQVGTGVFASARALAWKNVSKVPQFAVPTRAPNLP